MWGPAPTRRQEAFIEVDAFLDERLQLHQLAIAHSFAHDEGGVRVVSHVRHRTKLVRSASTTTQPQLRTPTYRDSGVKNGNANLDTGVAELVFGGLHAGDRATHVLLSRGEM